MIFLENTSTYDQHIPLVSNKNKNLVEDEKLYEVHKSNVRELFT